MSIRKLPLLAVALLFLHAVRAHGEWNQSRGLPGASVRCLAVNGANLFAATWSYGLFLSTDGGVSWNMVKSNPKGNQIVSLVVNGARVFACTDSGTFMTADGSASWLQCNVPLNHSGSIIVNGSQLFAKSLWGISLSADNGDTWKDLDPLLIGGMVGALAVHNKNIYAVGWNSTTGQTPIFRSTDDGNHWTTVYAGWTRGSINDLQISGSKLFVVTDSAGLFISRDSGQTWSSADHGITTTDILTLVSDGTTLYAGTGAGVFLSTDDGANWNPMNAGLTNTRILTISINNSQLYSGTLDGVFQSTNGGVTWSAINGGLANPPVATMFTTATQTLSGTSIGILRTTDDGINWNSISPDKNRQVTALASVGAVLFGTTGWNGQVIRSTDNGVNWNQVFTEDIYHVSSIAVIDTIVFVGTLQGVYRSTDLGTTWQPASVGLPTEISLTNDITALARQGDVLLAAAHGNGIFTTTNNGATWISAGKGLTNHTINALFVSGTNIFAGTDGGVFRSTDGGADWMAMNVGMPDTSILGFAVSGDNLFASTQHSGVFLSTTNGATWGSVGEGLPTDAMSALAVSGKNVIVGTASTGLWWRPLSEMTATNVATTSVVPFEFSVSPNPARDELRLRYGQHVANAGCDLYNVLGKCVMRLDVTGVGKDVVDVSALHAGIYFATLRAGSRLLTQMVVIAK